MSSSQYFKQLAQCCIRIASEIADNNGFVSVQNLVKRFKAKLFIRPLLVEGMLASGSETNKNDGNGHEWLLFIDSETSGVNSNDIEEERFGSPLPARLRNTVAHELAHSLAFRQTEFGVEFPKRSMSVKSRHEFVRTIEKETEKLSPFLLIPDNSLDRLFAPKKESITIQELTEFRNAIGVSRSVFINRLNLLSVSDEKRLRAYRQSLHNIAIGLGEWKSDSEAFLKDFPLYSRFDGGRVPSFIFQLQRRIEISAKALFKDVEFVLCGGKRNYTECMVSAGTPNTPNSIQLPIRCAIEDGTRKAGTKFLFTIQLMG